MSGGLGRLPAKDERDRPYTMRPFIPLRATPPPAKYWAFIRSPLDQGQEGACVGFAWTHFLLAAPLSRRRPDPTADARALYREAQRLDEWPGEDYEGTSVRAGAKVLETRGQLASYVWAWDATTVADYVLTRGSVVLGTNWYDGMDAPTPAGIARVQGGIRGGHAYLCLGYSRPRGAFRCLNSWGLAFAQKGRFWLTGEDLERLLREDGDACAAIEH